MRAFWTQATGLAEQAGDEKCPSAHLSTQHGVPETPTRMGLTFPLPHHLFISMGPPAEAQSFSLPVFFSPLFSQWREAESLWDDGFQWNIIYHLIQAMMVGRPAPWRDMANFVGHGEKGTDEWTPNAFTPELSEVFNFP